MRENHPLLRIGGPLLGLLLVIFFVNLAISGFQADQFKRAEAARLASQSTTSSEVSTPGKETASSAGAAPAKGAVSTPQPAATQPVSAAPEQQGSTNLAGVISAINGAGCAGCHTIPNIPGANGKVGPDLSKIGANAASRIDGLSAKEYIRQSILDPNAFIAPDCWGNPCPSGVMLQTFAQTLSEADLNAIVDYLSTLGTGAEVTVTKTAPAKMVMSLPAESVLEPFMALPKKPAPESQIALGKYLFFDKRLSGNVSLSCASCHQPENAFSDGLALSKGYPSTAYFRNTPTLYNTVFENYRYWDGRMDGSDMPTLVRDHLTEAHFMSMDGRLMFERLKQVPEYVTLFQDAFGGEPSFGKVLNAISAYVSTLNSPAGPYDAALNGDTSGLDTDQLAGYKLFTGKAGCSNCHTGSLLSDGKFYNTGVATDQAMFDDPERYITFRRFFRSLGTPNYRNLREDPGRYALTLDKADWGKFHTPSLREVGRTAPYMHNGSLATLEDVVRFYNDGGGKSQTAGLKPLGLSDAEIGQLVAFLESLSSKPVDVTAPALPDYGVMPLGDGSATASAAPTATAPAPTAPAPTATAPAATAPAAEANAPAKVNMDAVIAAINKGGCIACHTIPNIPGAVGVVGPNLSNIGVEGATYVPGLSVAEYIRQSIVDPNAFITPHCPTGDCMANVMPTNFSTVLSADEIDAIVGYLSTLKSEK